MHGEKKKGPASIIVAEMDDEDEMAESEENSDETKLAAAEELLEAFKSGDAKALMAALDDYMEC